MQPEPRREIPAAVLGGKIYVPGGNVVAGGPYTTELQEYDPTSDTWVKKTPMSTLRDDAMAATVGGILYVMGGYNDNTISSVEAYDPIANSWTPKSSMLTTRERSGVGVIGGKIYVAGGMDNLKGNSFVQTMEVYDPSTSAWTPRASMSGKRANVAASVVNDKLYVIGGQSFGVYVNWVEEYDPTTNLWATRTPMPQVRGFVGSAVVGNRIYVVGGQNGTGVLNWVEEYDPGTGAWTTRTPLPSPRSEHAVTALNGKIYVIAGSITGPPYLTSVLEGSWVNLERNAAASLLTAYVGQWVQVTLTVTNTGGMKALAVMPSIDVTLGAGLVDQISVSPPGTVELGWEESQTFTWTFSVSGAGAVNFSASATGTEEDTGNPAVGNAGVGFTALLPATLASSITTDLPDPIIGQWFDVMLTVTNVGDAAADLVGPSLDINAGTSLVEAQGTVTPAGPLTIGIGASTTFTWTFSVSGAGTVSFTATATGVCDQTGKPAENASSMGLTTRASSNLETSLVFFASQALPSQWFEIVLTVTNTGDATTNNVLPRLEANSNGTLVEEMITVNPPGSVSLAPAAMQTFTWTYSVSGFGNVSFTASAAGTEEGTGKPVLGADSRVFWAQEPATLSSVLSVSPSPASVGCWLELVQTVTNTGDVNALNVVPSLEPNIGASLVSLPSGPTPPMVAVIVPDDSQSFTWTYSATASGVVGFTATAAGMGWGIANPLSTSASTSLTTQLPPSLQAHIRVLPNPVSLAQSCLVEVTVSNTGGTAITGLGISPLMPGGTGSLTQIGGPNPAPIGLAPGATQTFTWTYTGATAGTVTFSTNVTGSNAICGQSVWTAATTVVPVNVVTWAVFAGSLSAPAQVLMGDWFDVVMTVSNTGGAAVIGTMPALQATTGNSLLVLQSGPTPAGPVVINSGSSQSFTWTYSTSGIGGIEFSGTVSGNDAVNGMPVSVSAARGMSAGAQAQLQVTVAMGAMPVRVGETVQVLVTVANTGRVSAQNVVPFLSMPGGQSLVSSLTGPTPVSALTLAAGASQRFTWTFQPTGTSTISFSASATGVDAAGGGAIGGNGTLNVTVEPALEVKAPQAGDYYVIGERDGVTVNPKVDGSARIKVVADTWGSVQIELKVYDPSGVRVIAQWMEMIPGREAVVLEWDCKDTSGTLVSPGAYPLSITGKGIYTKYVFVPIMY